jgi:hypothetical protein
MNINVSYIVIIVLIVIIFILPYCTNNNEHFSSSQTLSNEAIQTIASVYNTDNFTATKVTITDGGSITNNVSVGKDLSVGGNSTFTGDSTFSGKLNVGGDSSISGKMTIGKDVTINGNFTGQNLNVQGITSQSIVSQNYVPGAYIVGSTGTMPIFSSLKKYNGVNDSVGYVVLPGYKLIAYQVEQSDNNGNFIAGPITNASGQDKNNHPNCNTLTCDNTKGKGPLFCSSDLALPKYKPRNYNSYRDNQNFAGSGKSCQLSYGGKIITPNIAVCNPSGGNSNASSSAVNGSCSA